MLKPVRATALELEQLDKPLAEELARFAPPSRESAIFLKFLISFSTCSTTG
jgi:hypothetical protein